MLTRIEIDGFKSFEGFSLDLRPFMVVVGPNASGKSNLFDAIRFISNLAGTDVRSAVRGLRGEPHELFRRKATGKSANRISLAVEVLLAPSVNDPWGATVMISHSRMRYEVEVERRRDDSGIEKLSVTKEAARPIPNAADSWRTFAGCSKRFRELFMQYGRKTPWLETMLVEGKRAFQIHQDGHQGRTRSAEAAEATVLSSITSAEFPHLYALREELRSWRFLQLDPAALRRPSPTVAPEMLEPDGSNLAAVLARIQAETKTETQSAGAVAEVAAELAGLVPGVVDLIIKEDRRSREYRIELSMREEPPFSSRVISDGTLRILALLTLLHDPRHHGLLCFEEPENGVHPLRLKTMIERLRDLTTDPRREAAEPDESFSQILLNSHSPVVLSCLEESESLFADMARETGGTSRNGGLRTRVRNVRAQGELQEDSERRYVTTSEVHRYLSTVRGATN